MYVEVQPCFKNGKYTVVVCRGWAHYNLNCPTQRWNFLNKCKYKNKLIKCIL